ETMPTLPTTTPASIVSLLKLMWNVDPVKRPAMSQAASKILTEYEVHPAKAADSLAVNRLSGVKRTAELRVKRRYEGWDGRTYYNRNTPLPTPIYIGDDPL
ncbi:hypothetical protein PFISCL1PPCAC_876, partial [Pristionchus fissidentatus]